MWEPQQEGQELVILSQVDAYHDRESARAGETETDRHTDSDRDSIFSQVDIHYDVLLTV